MKIPKSKFQIPNSGEGFTVIEMVVVVAVFLFIVGATIGIFISIVQNQKKVLAEQQLLNQISYVEEYMSKAIRMAAVAGDNNCIPKGDIYLLASYNGTFGAYTDIKFINQSGDASGNPICQEFFLGNCDPDNPATPVLCETRAGGVAVALTSTSLQINYVKFIINGSTNQNSYEAKNTDPVQPRVTMLFSVSIPNESARTIQTTVSQRNLNAKQ